MDGHLDTIRSLSKHINVNKKKCKTQNDATCKKTQPFNVNQPIVRQICTVENGSSSNPSTYCELRGITVQLNGVRL